MTDDSLTATGEQVAWRAVRVSMATSRKLMRDAGPLAGGIGAYGMAVAFMNTTLSLFFAEVVRAVPLMIGLFFVGRGAVSIVVSLVAGSVSDRLADRRTLLGFAGIFGAVGGLCFAVLRNYTALLVAGTVCFSINAVSLSQMYAYSSEFAQARGLPVTKFTSSVRSAFTASWVVGPPLGLYLASRYGFGPLYLVTGALLAVTGILGRWGFRRLPSGPAPGPVAGARPRTRLSSIRLSLPRRVLLLLGAVVAFAVINQVYSIDVPLYVTRTLGLPAELVGLMAGLSAAIEVPVMIVAAHLADRFGQVRVTLCAAVAAVAFFCLLPLVRSAPALLGLQLLNAMWVAVSLSLPMIMVQQETPSGMGGASALYGSTFMFATMLAGSITGMATTVLGFGNVFWLCAVLAAAAAGMLAIRPRH